MAQKSRAYVEEPIDHLLQGLMREVSLIASHVEVAVTSPSVTHPCGEEEKHLELVVSKLGGYIGEILEESSATHGHFLVVSPSTTSPPSPDEYASM
jgi:hypothetical protein